jgi:hypothetical protein
MRGVTVENFFKVAIVIYLISGSIFGLVCAWLAREKNRDENGWFLIGFLLGFVGLLLIGFAPKSEPPASGDLVTRSYISRTIITSLLLAGVLWASPLDIGFNICVPTADWSCSEMQLSTIQVGFDLYYSFDFSLFWVFGPNWILNLKSILAGILFVRAIFHFIRAYSNSTNSSVN